MRDVGIIVDGYSSGATLASSFKKRDIDCIHVQSQKVIPEVYDHTYRERDYLFSISYQDDFSSLIAEVKKFHPIFVIAGAEPGVELSDKLSEALGLASNGTRYSAARRNKHLMATRVREAGLNFIPWIESSILNGDYSGSFF